MSVIQFLSKIPPLSPEGRYLFLAIVFERMNRRVEVVDVSVSHLRDSFGVSHKVVSELLEYLQYHHVGEVTKARHGKHEFTFDSVYFNSLKEGGFLSVNEAFVAVFSPEIKTHLKLKELKLRPSNLLLIGIFILHANELGFVLSPMTKDDEWLTESKMRRLMGGINQSRLKSQLATLRSIGFIKSEAGGGVSPIYFGKFGKRYQIDSDFLFLLKNEKNAVFIDERISNFSDLIYETPECYLACHTVKDCTLKYEFDFELPFKLSFLLRKKLNLHERFRTIEYQQIPKKEIVDNFDLSRLELAPFFRRNILTLGILAKLEILTSLILINHWQALTKEIFEQLDQLIESDAEIQQVVQKNSIFTQKYLNERKNVELIEDVYCFWKNSLLSLSSGLAMSLAKVIRGHCGQNANLITFSLLIHDFQHYAKQYGKYPSCDISTSYVVDGNFYELNIVSSKCYISTTLCGSRAIDINYENLMINEHRYSIWSRSF